VPLAGTSPRARSIERGDGAVRSAHEAVTYSACVKVPARDRPGWVDVYAEGPTRARHIERGDGTVRNADVRMIYYVARIKVISSNRNYRVDAKGEGALEWARASAGSVERDDGAVASPHVAMGNIA
jgi:hypothetical protein